MSRPPRHPGLDPGPEPLVLVGPTASGKTAVGIELAIRLEGEIVSADARQIYRGMDIGTAKPTPDELAMAKNHLIDVADPDESYSDGRWGREAADIIGDILARGKRPIIVGGSGLYLDALFSGFSPVPEIPDRVRAELQEEAGRDLFGLYKRLLACDPEWASKVNPNDRQRIVRGMEVFETSGERLSDLQQRPREPAGPWKGNWFGLALDRSRLYTRIDKRVKWMVNAGLSREVRGLVRRGYDEDCYAMRSFGYREMIACLADEIDIDEGIRLIQQGTRRYAKRQMTWFRSKEQITWVDVDTLGSPESMAEEIVRQLHPTAASDSP